MPFMKIPGCLHLRREERWPAAVALVVIIAFNALMVDKYYDIFSRNTTGGFWSMFGGRFRVSGYDPIFYLVLSSWKVLFDGFRHPLLLWMLYVPAEVNHWLMQATGLNCAQIVTAVILTVADILSFLFLHRLLRDVVRVRRADAALLSALFFSFAYVMVPMVVPDHFAISQCLLLFTLYITGLRIRRGRPLEKWLTVLLFVLTAGITLSNGVKTFLAQWVAGGRMFFRWRNLLFVVLLPSVLLLAVSFSVGAPPRHKTKAERLAANREEARRGMPIRYDRTGEPIGRTGFLNWTDVTTSRADATVENLFGESIQLHSDHLLGDVWVDRPVTVRYRWAANYVVEAAVVLLFALGIWYGRRSRFLWLAMSWFAFDMLLSMALGFAINEVYLMGPHWLFVIPIAIAYLMRATSSGRLPAVRLAVLGLTLWLWIYNGTLFADYLLE